METLQYRLTSEAPLIFHNGRLANPLDYYAKEIKKISSKRKKTEADFEEMARLEWYGGMYLLDDEPCLPGQNLEGALVRKGSAARRNKMGPQAAAGLMVQEDFPLEYDGPKELNTLWKDETFRIISKMTVGQASVMRCRPIFHEWQATVEVLYVPTMLNESHVDQWMELAGREIGLCDWRPKYGRFTVEKL